LPHDVIVEKVGELGAGMIVMGTHGRSGLRHFILGSVAEKVVRLASVPVCTVRAAE
jgi:nucleotide-binding universal stress UspA family protein